MNLCRTPPSLKFVSGAPGGTELGVPLVHEVAPVVSSGSYPQLESFSGTSVYKVS